MTEEFKLCKDCTNMTANKPPRCKSSRAIDLVDGNENRFCWIERLDGIGRCGSLANNYSPK